MPSEATLKRLNTVWFHLFDFLEEAEVKPVVAGG